MRLPIALGTSAITTLPSIERSSPARDWPSGNHRHLTRIRAYVDSKTVTDQMKETRGLPGLSGPVAGTAEALAGQFDDFYIRADPG